MSILSDLDTEIKAIDLDWSRTHPCADCPFLRTSPFHQGVASGAPLLLQAIGENMAAHTCHKTDNRASCDGPRNYPGNPQHCAGIILMLLKTGKGMDLQIPLLKAADAGKLDLEKMMALSKKSPKVYRLGEFIRFYEQALREFDGTGETDDHTTI